MIYAFLDTNIFLQFKPLQEIPWEDLLGTEYTLVVPITVINELDQQKNSDKSRVRKRAKSALRLIEGLDLTSTTLPLEIGSKEPQGAIFSKYALDPNIGDDRIIASILEFEEPLQSCVLVSDDTGIRIKAKNKQIACQRIGEEYRLPTETSDEQKTITRLRKEILHLQNNKPKLTLSLDDGSTNIRHTVRDLDDEDSLANEMKLIRGKHNKLIYRDTNERDYRTPPLTLSQRLYTLTSTQVDKYNTDLDNYFQDYEKYLRQNYKLENKRRNSLEVKLILDNIGKAPACDITLELRFLEDISANISFEIDDRILPPTPPDQPSPGPILSTLYGRSYEPKFMRNVVSALMDNERPLVSKEDSCFVVRFDIQKIQHTSTYSLSPLKIYFEVPRLAKSFTLPYTFVADNCQRTMGELHIIIDNES